jgi:hypothetical protein
VRRRRRRRRRRRGGGGGGRKTKRKWEGRIRMDLRHIHGEVWMWMKLTQAKDWL